MKHLNLKDITLLALAASCLLQVGAQLFAVSVVASTLSQAPPRSLAMLEGTYGYDSSSFWDTLPALTFLLFIIAAVSNWKTKRRPYILFALSLFVISALIAGFFLDPFFADIIKGGYSDTVDPKLQELAKSWYTFDWMVWILSLVAGLTLLLALTLPVRPKTGWE